MVAKVHNYTAVPYIPGLIHHPGGQFRDIDTQLLRIDQGAEMKAVMRGAGSMTGSKDLTLGVFQRMFSYGQMPFNDMAVAFNDDLSIERKRAMLAFAELIQNGLRPSEDVLKNWLRGYYGSTPESCPPYIKGEYDFEVDLHRAKEEINRANLRNPSPETQKWMSDLDLIHEVLRDALVNPFQIDISAYVPPEVLLRMRDLGLFKLKIPKEYGGFGLNQREYDIVLRGLTRAFSGTLGGIVSAHSTIGSAPLVKFGTKEQQEYYLPQLAECWYLAAFGLTEPESGTDAIAKAETAAKRDDDKWIMNGRKEFITNTQRAGIMYVMANADMGGKQLKPTVFILELPFRITDSIDLMYAKRKVLAKGLLGELTDEERKAFESAKLSDSEIRGLRLNEKGAICISEPLDGNTIRGSNQAYIEFVDCELNNKNEDGIDIVLGGEEKIGQAADSIFNSLNAGRAGFGTFCAEASRGAFEISLIEGVQRERFKAMGGRLADLKKVKSYYSEMAVKVAVANATAELTTALINKYPHMNIIGEAAAIKAFGTEEAWDIAQTVCRIHGGMGTMKGQVSELLLRDLWIPMIVEGVNEALKQHMVLVGSKPAMNDRKTLAGKLRILGKRFHFEKGPFDFWDALRLTGRTELLSARALVTGAWYGDKTMLEQDKLLALADKGIELYTVVAVLLKLQQIAAHKKEREKDKPLTLEHMREDAEEAALEQYIKNDKWFGLLTMFNRYPHTLADNYIDVAGIEVSRQIQTDDALVKEYRTTHTPSAPVPITHNPADVACAILASKGFCLPPARS